MFSWFRRNGRSDALTEKLTDQYRECTAKIIDKWIYFNNTFKFKNSVSLADQIDSFSAPISEFVENHYSLLLKGPNPGEFFWTMLFTGVLESKTHSANDVNKAIEILRSKYEK